jgi:hypothetical protein
MKLSFKHAIWTTFLSLTMPVSALVSADYQENVEKSGAVYIGVQGGPASYNGRYTAQEGVNTVAFESGSTSGIIGGCIGVDGRFGLGYLALEGNVYYDTLDQMIGLLTSATGIPNHIIKIKNPLLGGGLAKLGFFAEDVAIYVLGGVTAGRWYFGLENDSAISWTRGIAPQNSMFFSKNMAGAKVGGGVRFPFFYDWIHFDVQYSYNWYGECPLPPLRDLQTNLVWNHTFRNEQHMFLFSLNADLYSF